jgi:hypothetical protein
MAVPNFFVTRATMQAALTAAAFLTGIEARHPDHAGTSAIAIAFGHRSPVDYLLTDDHKPVEPQAHNGLGFDALPRTVHSAALNGK